MGKFKKVWFRKAQKFLESKGLQQNDYMLPLIAMFNRDGPPPNIEQEYKIIRYRLKHTSYQTRLQLHIGDYRMKRIVSDWITLLRKYNAPDLPEEETSPPNPITEGEEEATEDLSNSPAEDPEPNALVF